MEEDVANGVRPSTYVDRASALEVAIDGRDVLVFASKIRQEARTIFAFQRLAIYQQSTSTTDIPLWLPRLPKL